MIKLATASQPHGLRGEVELRLLNNETEESILDDGMKVWIFPGSEKSKVPKEGVEWTITKLRFGNKVLCTFEGIIDRTHLETFLPIEIRLPREAFPEPDEDEIYIVDLIGQDVVSPEGEKLGVLESVSDNGMQFIFDVRLLSDGSIMTLPYVDAFFPEITEEKKIVMILPDYTE